MKGRTAWQLLAILLAVSWSTVSGDGRAGKPGSDPVADESWYLGELAYYLKGESPALRAELSLIAIEAMTAAYRAEAQRARQDMRKKPADRGLAGWISAVDDMSRELQTLAGAVSATSQVIIGVNQENSVYLVIDGRPLIVNGPRIHEQTQLEQQIVERFCVAHPCDQWLAGASDSGSVPGEAPPEVETLWSFSGHAGPLCESSDGSLGFQFTSMTNIGWKRRQCQRVVTDLHILAQSIVRRKQGGSVPQWSYVRLLPAGDGRVQRVELNHKGDYIEAYLPALAANDRLFPMLRPWLQGRVENRPVTLRIDDAEQSLLPVNTLEVYEFDEPLLR